VGERLRVLVAGWPNSPHLRAWAEAVAAAGHDVHVAGRDAPQLPASTPGPRIHPLRAEGPPLLRSFRLSKDLARLVAELSPDLVHAHWLPESGWMAAREGLQPLVCSAWGSDVFGARGLGRQRAKLALKRARLVLADSQDLASATRDLGGVDVEVVRWGLDLERFSPGDPAVARRALELRVDGPLIASVRGLEPLYNPELLLEAFALVRRQQPGARLLLKSPDERVPPRVSSVIERLGLGQAVDLLGNVPVERMPDVYRSADVVVSVPSSDSSPRSVWEALACGRPLVVSDLPWAREELEDGLNALLAPLNPEGVAHAIEGALEDGLSFGKKGRALAAAQLDPGACTARIDRLYRSVVTSR
jgi:glycosyltransferase involved in cell wall biosynthesis